MLVKFLVNKGGGSPRASIDYLLGKNRDREQAEILQGDPELSLKIAEGCDFNTKYTVGVLSFEEADIAQEKKYELMEDFEKMLFAGLDQEQYNISWIEHRDKGRLELNFFVPNVELTTGKRLQPYYHFADKNLVHDWQKVINYKNGFSDPDDPLKKQISVVNPRLPKDKKALVSTIDEIVEKQVKENFIKNRDDVVGLVTSLGLEITRKSKAFISIKDPEGGKNIRLKGLFYEQNFRASEIDERAIEQRARDYKERRESECDAVQSRLRDRIETRYQFNQKNYSTKLHKGDIYRSDNYPSADIRSRNLSGDVGREAVIPDAPENGADFRPSERRFTANERVIRASKTITNNSKENEKRVKLYDLFRGKIAGVIERIRRELQRGVDGEPEPKKIPERVVANARECAKNEREFSRKFSAVAELKRLLKKELVVGVRERIPQFNIEIEQRKPSVDRTKSDIESTRAIITEAHFSAGKTDGSIDRIESEINITESRINETSERINAIKLEKIKEVETKIANQSVENIREIGDEKQKIETKVEPKKAVKKSRGMSL